MRALSFIPHALMCEAKATLEARPTRLRKEIRTALILRHGLHEISRIEIVAIREIRVFPFSVTVQERVEPLIFANLR